MRTAIYTVRVHDFDRPRLDWRFAFKLPICFVISYLRDWLTSPPNMELEFHIVVAMLLAFAWTFLSESPANFELEIGENYIAKRDIGDSNTAVIERRDLEIKERSAGIFSRFSGLEIRYPSGWPWYRTRSFFVPEAASGYSQIKADLLRQT